MYLHIITIHSVIFLLHSYTFKINNKNYIINDPKNKFFYRIYNSVNENNFNDSDSKDDITLPHGIADPIPSHLNFLEDEKDVEIRQTLWDERVPIDKVFDRIDQIQNPKKYEKIFEDYMTTSVTLSSHPSKKEEEDDEDKVENEYEESDYDSEDYNYDEEELLSFDFFHIHPYYVGFLEKLMSNKANDAAGIGSEDITTSEFDNKIISSDYFNRAAELALDLNCLVEADITSINWILEVNNVVENVLASHNYKLESIKWTSNTLFILIKQKNLDEYEFENLQNELKQEIYKLKFKFHIPKLDMLGIFLESEPLDVI